MVELKQLQLKSKKTGKPFTAYVFEVGKFRSPIFFPSEIELMYIQKQLNGDDSDEFETI